MDSQPGKWAYRGANAGKTLLAPLQRKGKKHTSVPVVHLCATLNSIYICFVNFGTHILGTVLLKKMCKLIFRTLP